MSFLPAPQSDSLPRPGHRHGSYLTLHRQVRYFRITVPHHLQSLLGKKEIRRSLDGMNSRMARVKAMQLSVIAQTFFAFLDDLHCKRIRLMQEDTIQYAENIRKISSSLDTFWFDTALRENLSPAALVLRLPSFLKDAGLGIDDVSPSEQKILQHN